MGRQRDAVIEQSGKPIREFRLNIDARIRSRSNELTLLAFMATVVMLFAAFTSAYLIRRTGSDWDTLSLP